MNRTISIFILCFVILVRHANAQEIDTALVNKIKYEALYHSKIPSIAYGLMELSGPRLTNSPGYQRAADWSIAELKKWGIDNGRLESYGEFGRGWEIQKSHVALYSPYYQPIIGYPQGWCGSTDGIKRATVVSLKDKDVNSIASLSASFKGKVVLLEDNDTLIAGSPFATSGKRYSEDDLSQVKDIGMLSVEYAKGAGDQMTRKRDVMRELKKAGAVAVLTQGRRTGGMGRDGTVFVDGFYYRFEKDPIAEMVLAPEEFLKLRRMIHAKAKVEVELEVATKFFDNVTGNNVIAEIPGSDPVLKNEVVMLGAHLDSWHTGTGATDDGAGCTIMMEAVRILKALNIKPARTIRLALWGGEEQGVLGSMGYVRNHFGDSRTMALKPEHKNVSAYYNIDIGTGKIRGLYLQGNEQLRTLFTDWFKPFEGFGVMKVVSASCGATDHQPFDVVGIPGFQFVQDPIEYMQRTHHTNVDTYDHLVMDDLKQSAAIVAAFVYLTASRAERLPRKPLPAPTEWAFDYYRVKN